MKYERIMSKDVLLFIYSVNLPVREESVMEKKMIWSWVVNLKISKSIEIGCVKRQKGL